MSRLAIHYTAPYYTAMCAARHTAPELILILIWHSIEHISAATAVGNSTQYPHCTEQYTVYHIISYHTTSHHIIAHYITLHYVALHYLERPSIAGCAGAAAIGRATGAVGAAAIGRATGGSYSAICWLFYVQVLFRHYSALRPALVYIR